MYSNIPLVFRYIAGSAIAKIRKVLSNTQTTKAVRNLLIAQQAKRQIALLQKFTVRQQDISDSSDYVECEVRQRQNCHLTYVSDNFGLFWDALWEYLSTFFRDEAKLQCDTPKSALKAALNNEVLKDKFADLCVSADQSDISGEFFWLNPNLTVIKYW